MPSSTLAMFGQHHVHEIPILAAVDSYEEGKNPYGLHHMAGNIAEWVQEESTRYYTSDGFTVHRFIAGLVAQRNPVDSFRSIGSLSTRVKIRTVGASFCQPAPLITFFVPVSGPFGFFLGLF